MAFKRKNNSKLTLFVKKIALTLLMIFVLPMLVSPCLADTKDIRTLEDRAAQRYLNHFIQVLKNARNVAVYPNNLLRSDHLEEEANYCSALLDAAKKRNGAGITVPVPNMSTGRDGTPAILEYIRKRTVSCPRERWLKEGIPTTLTLHPEYPRLYSIYELKGANPIAVVLERRFYDLGYEDLRSVHWVNLQDGCYVIGESSPDYPRGSEIGNQQTGVLQFAGEIFFYEMLDSDQWPVSPGYEGFDRTRKWYVQLFAPQKSVEELFSREAAEYLNRLPYGMGMLVDPNWYCQIAFD